MAVIVDRCADFQMLSALEKLNIKYYKSAALDYLYKPVNTHPDMQIHFVDLKTAIVAPAVYDYYRELLPKSIFLIKGAKNPGSTYPEDCAYNVAKLGKRIIGNLLYTDTAIKDIYSELGFEFINTKQGYTKCNLCIVDDNSVITEDSGLAKTLIDAGVNVLKISSGEVELKCFDNGFIGGASGLIKQKQLAFCGDISNTSYFSDIAFFTKSRCVDIISLSQTSLCDYGSILYFEE